MALYLIILDKPAAGPWEAIPEHWPDHLIIDDRVAYISADSKTLTANIAEKVGIGPEGPAGVVVQMDFFAGFSSSSLAEWISKNRD